MRKVYITHEAHSQLHVYNTLTSPSLLISSAEQVENGVIIELSDDVLERLFRHQLPDETVSDTIIRIINKIAYKEPDA